MPSATKSTERLSWLLWRDVGADVIVGGFRNDTPGDGNDGAGHAYGCLCVSAAAHRSEESSFPKMLAEHPRGCVSGKASSTWMIEGGARVLRCNIFVPRNTSFCCHSATEGPGILRLFQSKRRMEIVSCPNIDW